MKAWHFPTYKSLSKAYLWISELRKLKPFKDLFFTLYEWILKSLFFVVLYAALTVRAASLTVGIFCGKYFDRRSVFGKATGLCCVWNCKSSSGLCSHQYSCSFSKTRLEVPSGEKCSSTQWCSIFWPPGKISRVKFIQATFASSAASLPLWCHMEIHSLPEWGPPLPTPITEFLSRPHPFIIELPAAEILQEDKARLLDGAPLTTSENQHSCSGCPQWIKSSSWSD